VHLAFDIFQGMGIAAAVGIRPFLPALVAGALAAGSVAIHFNGTAFSFLQSVPFLIGMAVGAVGLLLLERRLTARPSGDRSATPIVVACAIVLGALLFAGALARGHYAAWPGVIGGVLCAVLAAFAIAPLVARVRTRLGHQDAAMLPLYLEGSAALVALLSVVAPPVGVISVLFLVWLLLAGRRRAEQKYAGLRILR
jgi:hypothetical protein